MGKKFILFFLLIISNYAFSLERTLYVDNFNDILGSPSKEDKLLLFAQKNKFKILIFYDLNKINKRITLSDPRKNNILAEFILKAKQKYQIKKMGVSGESADFFVNVINVYNNSRQKAAEKFDIYNLEYEYWSNKASGVDGYYCINYLEENGIPCGREGSFKFYIDNLKKLKKLTKGKPHKVEIDAYVGYYTQNEIIEIAKNCDRLIIQANGKDPKFSLESSQLYLEYLLSCNSAVKASISFSTTMNNLGYWLKFESLDRAEFLFLYEMNSKNNQLKKRINIEGFSYHTYSFLEKSINFYNYNKN